MLRMHTIVDGGMSLLALACNRRKATMCVITMLDTIVCVMQEPVVDFERGENE